MNTRPLVVHTETIGNAARAWLEERADVIAAGAESDAFAELAPRIDALLVRTYTKVDEALLDRLPRLKVVGRAGVGVDNIEVTACRNRGVEVVYAPASSTHAVAEYVVALLCDALRPRVYLQDAEDRSRWSHHRKTLVAGRQFDELTLGILGMGRIGSTVAGFAEALGFQTIATDLESIPLTDRHGAGMVSVEALFEQADVLTIHVDGRRANRGLIGDDLLGRMKRDAVLINTSRGFVMQHDPLRRVLEARTDLRAFLDVHDPEPPPPGDRLFELPNAHLLPHLASRTETAMARMSDVVQDLWAVLNGQEPTWPAPAE